MFAGFKGIGAVPMSELSEGSEAEEEPASEATQKLMDVLSRYEHVELDVGMLQSLSTYDLTPEQKESGNIDLLTGFQLIDGECTATAVV